LAELTYAYDYLDKNDADTVGLRAEMRARQALFFCEIGAFEACVQAANEARALVIPDTSEEHLGVIALAELCQGYAHWSQGEYVTAQTHLETAVSTVNSLDLSWIKAQSLNTLGNVLLDQGDIPTAHTYYAQALAIAEPAGQPRMEASIHINMGNAYWHSGDFNAARQQFQQAFSLADMLGMKQLESLALLNSGLVDTELGDHAEGIAHMEQALQLSRDVGDRRGEGNVLVNLIAAFMEAHRLGEARNLLHDALSICREVGDKQGEAIALELTADWHLAVGAYDRAEALLTEVVALCTANDDTWGLMEMQLSLAHLYDQRGLWDEAEVPALSLAEVAVRDGLAQTQSLQDQANEAKAYTLLGTILMHKEDYVEAAVAYETAVSLRRELEQPHLLVEAQAGQFYCQQALGQPPDDNEVSQLVDTLMASPLNGILMPGQLYHTIWQLLLAQKNPRAAELRQHGANFLQQVAAPLPEPARHTFLNQVPSHQALLSAMNLTE
jgi:tetratricopeptide (TPR) repeat protein